MLRLIHLPVNYACLAPVHRELEVLFAGRICGGREQPDSTRWPNCPLGVNVGYSQGVRQMMHYHHWNRTGFKIDVMDKSYVKVSTHGDSSILVLGLHDLPCDVRLR